MLAGEMVHANCSNKREDQRCFVATQCQVPNLKRIVANAAGIQLPDAITMGTVIEQIF
jgi:hypothetical protein